MNLTTARHTALARLSDGEWRTGRELGAPSVLSSLHRAGMIRDDMSGDALQDRLWCITPDGLAALKGAGE